MPRDKLTVVGGLLDGIAQYVGMEPCYSPLAGYAPAINAKEHAHIERRLLERLLTSGHTWTSRTMMTQLHLRCILCLLKADAKTTLQQPFKSTIAYVAASVMA